MPWLASPHGTHTPPPTPGVGPRHETSIATSLPVYPAEQGLPFPPAASQPAGPRRVNEEEIEESRTRWERTAGTWGMGFVDMGGGLSCSHSTVTAGELNKLTCNFLLSFYYILFGPF